jgi:hypothetical protein
MSDLPWPQKGDIITADAILALVRRAHWEQRVVPGTPLTPFELKTSIYPGMSAPTANNAWRLTESERAAAAQRLGLLPGKVPGLLMAGLRKWVAAGMPLRRNWEALWKVPCEHRRPSGMCGRLGCAVSEKGYHVACVWLCKMETADCPAGKWPGEYPPAGGAAPEASSIAPEAMKEKHGPDV